MKKIQLRGSFNGRISASQAEDAGSIPVPRLLLLELILCLPFLLNLSGCANMKVQKEIVTIPAKIQEGKGIYHRVNEGETIWRIAQTYDVSVEDIVRINNIPDMVKIEKDQLIFIPGAQMVKNVYVADEHHKEEFVWPIKGKVIHYFHQRLGRAVNQGIDIQTQPGETVKAARSGKVVFADSLPGYGRTLILDHQDGFFTIYAQNSQLLVHLDDVVAQNQSLAYIGQSGDLSFLHFQIRKNSKEYNPLYYLP